MKARKVTREEAIAELKRREDEKKGFTGIGNDISESWSSAPGALVDMVKSIPEGINKVGDFATSHNPVTTLANLGAGAVEGGAGLLSSPQILMRYLAEKFPELGKKLEQSNMGGGSFKDPTFYEKLMQFEQEHGMSPQGDEASVRNAGGLVFGGGALKKLPGMLSRTAAVTGEQAGRGGDPLHAAILAMAGDMLAKTPVSKVAEIPRAASNAVKSIPELAASGAATGLETIADLGTKAHIPGLQPTLGALGAYLKHISVAPETLAKRRLFGDLGDADMPKINERLEAAKRLGLDYLTPAEATLSPFEAAKQGQVGRTSSGSKLLYEKGKQRTGSEQTAISNLLDTIYNDSELKPEMKAAYEQTMSGSVPEDFIARHSSDPIIEEAINQLHSDPVYRKALGIDKKTKEAGNVPKNSFEYWDQVKRVLGDMEEGNSAASGRKPYKKAAIAATRRAMVEDMDAIKPEYKVARNISERGFTRAELEKVFDKKSMTGNNFYKYLQSNKKFNETMGKLKAFPEAQQKLTDMRTLFGDLIPSDPSIRTAAALEKTSMSSARNKLDAAKRDLDERYGREHDVATVNLMTDPDWMSKLTEYLNKNGK